MVDGLNAVEIAVGGVAGAAFGSIFDGITEVLRNAAEFTTSHANIKSTLEALQPLIREIEGKNKRLLLQDEELKDLKKEIEAGVKRVQELSKKSVWNYCMRPLYNMELDGMDKSLKRLLRILQVQGVRDVKDVLVQVNDCKTDVNKISIQLDDCKTGIVRYGEETLNMTRTVLDLFERINGPSGFVPISEKVASLVEEEALRSSLLTMRHAVDEALSKPNPHNNISRIEEALSRVVEELGDADENRKLDMGVHEVKWFRIKVEEGTELIRKCSNVVEWTDRKMVKYANKLDDLVKFLEAFGQRLKRTNSTMPKGFDTQNSITLISFLSLLPSLFKSLSLSLICFTFFVSPPITLFILLLLFLSISSNHLFSFSFFQSFFTFFSPVSSFSLTCDPPISLSSLNCENQTEIENEKLIFMKSNRSTDDVNGENRTKIENEKLIFMKSNRPTDDVNGENRTEIENAKLIFMKSNQPTDDVNGENRTEIENEMLIFKKSNRPTDDVNGLRNDGKIGLHDSSVFGYSSTFPATSNFAEENKLGEGGFGPVYKGKLAMGQKKAVKWHRMLFFKKSNRPTDAVNGLRNDGKIGHQDSSVFSYSSILAATSNFAEENKLGQGGFGKVYKGKLAMGQEIAVKRLSKHSGQGLSEFKNELILIYELQHTNLVQLFGSCIHGKEMMLIYEYLQNTSLDCFLFDPTRGRLLDWKKRFSIIEGIAQGLLYLHKYSRKKVIHRDIKASNILLDENMNPKISDFGLARIFTQNELEANTSRIVVNPKNSDFGTARMFTQNELEPNTHLTTRIAGTIGYMAPETLSGGIISVKSDVYSFGVLMLEIISGRKNNRFYNDRPLNLVTYAWELWKEGAGLELMDPTLGNSFIKEQLLRCIHVGLLCVEENAADRPTMSDVISMLINESLPLASPTKAPFCFGRRTVESQTGINMSQQLEMESQTGTNMSQQLEMESQTGTNWRQQLEMESQTGITWSQ